MRSSEIRSVIFDMDGVLIDTVLLHWKAYNELLIQRYGVSVKEEELADLIGMSLPEQIPLLEKKFNITIDGLSFVNDANTLKEKSMQHIVSKPGVEALLQDLKEKKIKLGVGTSTSESVAKKRLTDIGIAHYFDVIVGEESIANHKPDPEVYNRVAEMLKVKPEQSVVFEDAPTGIAAAKSAGMHCVAVQTTYVPKSYLSNADYIVPTLENLNFSSISKLLKIKELH